MFVMNGLTERGRRARFVAAVRDATDEAAALSVIERDLDPELEGIVGRTRNSLSIDPEDRTARRARIRVLPCLPDALGNRPLSLHHDPAAVDMGTVHKR